MVVVVGTKTVVRTTDAALFLYIYKNSVSGVVSDSGTTLRFFKK